MLAAPTRLCARRSRQGGECANDAAHRRRSREHVAGDDDERHLQRERNQFPEAAAPGVDDLRQRGGRRRGAGDYDDERSDDREDERVGNPALGPRRQRERQTRKGSDVVTGDVPTPF